MRKISLAQLGHVRADPGAHFDDRLVQLALDLVAERGRARGQQLRDVRPQLPGLRVDDLELLFDADVKRCGRGDHNRRPARDRHWGVSQVTTGVESAAQEYSRRGARTASSRRRLWSAYAADRRRCSSGKQAQCVIDRLMRRLQHVEALGSLASRHKGGARRCSPRPL